MTPTQPESGPRNGAALRTFFALWPDAGARDALSALAGEIAARTRGRAPAAGNLHLTLAFLGDVVPARLAVLRAIGAAVAAAVPRFALVFDRVGAFGEAGIAWAGASAPPRELERLAQLLQVALTNEGFPIERRPFHPHVTLARVKRAPRAGFDEWLAVAATMKDRSFGAMPVDELILYSSELTPRGPVYSAVNTWELGAGK